MSTAVEPKHVGDGERLSLALDVAGVPTDPTALTLTVIPPNAAATVLNWPVPADIARDSAGRFHYDLVLSAAGAWRWDWDATGAATGSDDGFVYVLPAITTDAPPILAGIEEVKIVRRDVTAGATDELISQLLVMASAAVMDWTGGRRFVPLATATDRYFPVDHTTIPIDDLSEAPAVGEVELFDANGTSAGVVVAADYVLQPRNRNAWEPITSIRMRPGVSLMTGYELRVKGKWGWPRTPGPVREAVVEAVIEWLKSGAALTIPSPDAFEPGTPPARALPLKSRDLLLNGGYARRVMIA